MKKIGSKLIVVMLLLLLTGCELLLPEATDEKSSHSIAQALKASLDNEDQWHLGVAYVDSLNQWYMQVVELYRGASRTDILDRYSEIINQDNIDEMMHYIEINQYLYNNIPNERSSDQIEATYLGVMVAEGYYQGITVMAFRDDNVSIMNEKMDTNVFVSEVVNKVSGVSEYFWMQGRFIISCDANFLVNQKISLEKMDQIIEDIFES